MLILILDYQNNNLVDFMISNQFVYIIESPSNKDLLNGTMEGKALLESLNLAQIPCTHNLVIDRNMLQVSLTSKLNEECVRLGNKLPLLHLSMHGNEKGISLSNNDFLNWQELWQLLTPISNAMQGGLVICMSTCFGSYGAYMANFAQKSLNYGALIGNTSKTQWADSAVAYITFYHQYFKELPINECVDAMKIASGDHGFKLHWGNEVRWRLKELAFEVNMFRQNLGYPNPSGQGILKV
jgi:hypothetical protein